MKHLSSICLIVALLVGAAGCNPGPTYKTELTVTRGLRTGDPVTHDDDKIGEVRDIQSLPNGKYAVSFTVNKDRANTVRRDSIAAIKESGGPARLEIVTPNPDSPPAPPGSEIAGAATDAEAALLAGHNQLKGLAGSIGEAINSINSNIEALARSPAWDQLRQDIDNVSKQIADAGDRGSDILNRELPRLQSEFRSLEDKLIKEGKSDDAKRLRQQFDKLSRSLSSPSAHPTPKPDVD